MGESQLTFAFQAPDLSYNQLNLAGYQGQLWGQGWSRACLEKVNHLAENGCKHGANTVAIARYPYKGEQ